MSADPPSIESPTKPLSTHKLVAIIPAYNESKTIHRVLQALGQISGLAETIVVDDGSTDETLHQCELAAQSNPRLRVIRHKANLGKGQAIYSGWTATNAHFLLLLDADLFGLERRHVEELVRPVLAGQVDMSIGLFKKGYWKTDLSHWGTPWLSGQRCLRAELLNSISWEAASGYGIETALTVAAQLNGWRVGKIPLWGMWHKPSEDRRGYWSGAKTRGKMYLQIIRAWYIAGGPQRMAMRMPFKPRGHHAP